MHNIHLPLSWILSDTKRAHFDIINLNQKWKWIYSAQIPESIIFQNIKPKIDFLNENCIIADMTATSKQAALEELAATLVPGSEGLDLTRVVDVLMDLVERELA